MGRLHRTRATHTQRQQWLARSPPLPPPPPSSALAHMRVVQALCLHAACGAHTVVSRALDSSPCAADVAALARDTSMRRATISRSRLRQHSHPPNARRARRAHRSSSAATDAVARSPTVSRSPCAASAAAAADLAAAMSRRSAASAARQAEWSAAATSAASSPARICRYGASVTERQLRSVRDDDGRSRTPTSDSARFRHASSRSTSTTLLCAACACAAPRPTSRAVTCARERARLVRNVSQTFLARSAASFAAASAAACSRRRICGVAAHQPRGHRGARSRHLNALRLVVYSLVQRRRELAFLILQRCTPGGELADGGGCLRFGLPHNVSAAPLPPGLASAMSHLEVMQLR